MLTPIIKNYTKIMLLLSFMLVSSGNAQETTLSNLAHTIERSANAILFNNRDEEPASSNSNPNLGPMLEPRDEIRFPELTPDLDAQLRAHIWNKNALSREKKRMRVNAEAGTTNNKVVASSTNKKEKGRPSTTSSGLRGSRSTGNNGKQHN